MKPTQGINKRIDQVKKHFGYTNEELGKVCEVSYAAIAKIVNGDTKDPSLSLIVHISRKLGVSIKWLALGEGEMFEEPGKVRKLDNSDFINSMQAQLAAKDLIIEAKNDEISTLKKIVRLLEEKIEQRLIKKKAS